MEMWVNNFYIGFLAGMLVASVLIRFILHFQEKHELEMKKRAMK